MTRSLRTASLLASLGALLIVAGRVWAGGIPTSDALHYSGTLADASGAPLTGEHFIEVKLWHNADSDADPADCATKSEKRTLQSGGFSVLLPAACREAIARYPDMFVEVIVDGATLGRAKLGAVPYAVEADHAEKADTAEAAAGGLKATLDSAAERSAALEAATTPGGVVERFNAATNDGTPVRLGPVEYQTEYDIGWALQHAAAAGGCAAASPNSDSSSHHIVLVKPSAVTCEQACLSSGRFTKCRTSIAVGSIAKNQAKSYSDIVSINYNYVCQDNQAAYDEVLGQGLNDGSYSAYCCCYE
jgi:hypothetical protein